jgi:hypothetical protein
MALIGDTSGGHLTFGLDESFRTTGSTNKAPDSSWRKKFPICSHRRLCSRPGEHVHCKELS